MAPEKSPSLKVHLEETIFEKTLFHSGFIDVGSERQILTLAAAAARAIDGFCLRHQKIKRHKKQ